MEQEYKDKINVEREMMEIEKLEQEIEDNKIKLELKIVQELISKGNRFVKVGNVIKTIEEVVVKEDKVKHVLVEYVAKTMEMEDQININNQKEDNFNLELEIEDNIKLHH